MGTLTRRVLRGWRDGEPDPAAAYVAERGPEVSAGNGSVMYCAPLGFAYAERPDDLFEAAPALSGLTHADERCRTACLAVTLAAAALVRGEHPEAAVRDALAAVDGREGAEELEYLVGGAGIERPIDGPDQGFVFFTAGVALRLAGEARPFEQGLRSVVALGGDTDTNAAVAGALLGALHGTDALPAPWLDRLAEHDAIEKEAAALARRRAGRGGLTSPSLVCSRDYSPSPITVNPSSSPSRCTMPALASCSRILPVRAGDAPTARARLPLVHTSYGCRFSARTMARRVSCSSSSSIRSISSVRMSASRAALACESQVEVSDDGAGGGTACGERSRTVRRTFRCAPCRPDPLM